MSQNNLAIMNVKPTIRIRLWFEPEVNEDYLSNTYQIQENVLSFPWLDNPHVPIHVTTSLDDLHDYKVFDMNGKLLDYKVINSSPWFGFRNNHWERM